MSDDPATHGRPPGFAAYWSKRGRMSFIFTRHGAYRLGAYLAIPLGRLGVPANAVTVLALVVAAGGTWASLALLATPLAQAVGIFVAMGVGYGLDCADGMLARVHGTGSLFGAIFDKVSDVISLVLCCSLLAAAKLDAFAAGPSAAVIALGAMVGVRLALDVAVWLKEFVGKVPDRRAEDQRERNLGYLIRRSAGALTDHALYILLVSIAWALELFWEFFIVYHVFIAAMLAAYLASLYREVGRQAK